MVSYQAAWACANARIFSSSCAQSITTGPLDVIPRTSCLPSPVGESRAVGGEYRGRMESEDPSLDTWYEGHTSLDEAVERVQLSRYQTLELAVLSVLIGIVRPVYWMLRRALGKPYGIADGLDDLRDMPCTARGERVQETHGGSYLTRAEVDEFERNGVIGPFTLLEPDEAAELRDFMVESQAADWNGDHVISQEIVDELKRSGLWGIKQGSLWQEHNIDRIRAVAQRPALGERLASLLGDEVIAWRTQIFAIPGGGKGTFWHSATTFVEDGALPTLTPPADMPPALANINCWIALEDVDETNSCLHMVPGTHVDNRLDTILRRLGQDRIGFAMSVDRRVRRQLLIAVRYSGDLFMAIQVAFEGAMTMAPDLYEAAQPKAFPMKAGEVLIFSSNNVHCSHENHKTERLAMGIRATAGDVGIYEDQDTIPFACGTRTVPLETTVIKQGTTLHTASGAVGEQADLGVS